MQINKISPNFKGLIVIKEHPTRESIKGQAIDTKDIAYLQGQPNGVSTYARTFLGRELFLNASFDSIIDAYKKASKGDDIIVELESLK